MSDDKPKFVAVFDNVKRLTNKGIEYWSARDLQSVLGYERWENFEAAVSRAMAACQAAGILVQQQFRETTKQAMSGGG